MKMDCPKCGEPVPDDQVNVATDVAFCPACDEIFSLSKMISAGKFVSDFDIHSPPSGAWFEDHGLGCQVGATTRSCAAFFLVPFMCVWSGFSLGGIYGTQIAAGKFNLVISLFGIPFLFGTILFGSITLMAIFGKVVVTIDGNDGSVFTGIGPVGWTRRFDWREISAIEEEIVASSRSTSNYRSTMQVISLLGQKRLRFGSMLSQARRYYMLQVLRTLLARRG
ncbi:hypothetical protein Pan216_47050 [Planctomycetes bacterium Pan216]|uniref:Uncharacterized protein n=1 Tax=Kolteria novifilia TaxID=2527975 RepID=A0A518BA19_9BACT|nr:hypothetical protein Pan216_47050 [Planctomycetes bacterium Pan216]